MQYSILLLPLCFTKVIPHISQSSSPLLRVSSGVMVIPKTPPQCPQPRPVHPTSPQGDPFLSLSLRRSFFI